MKVLNRLIPKLAPFIGGKVKQGFLLIWPDEHGHKESDIRIHLGLECTNGLTRHVTLGTDSDGQTPLFLEEAISPCYRLTDLTAREDVWKEDTFWQSEREISYESFDMRGFPEYDHIIDHRIEHIAILHFNDEEKTPTGLSIRFDSGKELYSLPGITGNTILTQLPQNWYFPELVKSMQIRKAFNKA